MASSFTERQIMNLDRPPATPEQKQQARDIYTGKIDDDILIDTDALASIAENGVWVQAWVWVPNEEDV